MVEKNTEIDSLLVNLETRKQQISNMEKIILTLEDQTRKASLQRKKDQDHIMSLQNKISDFEALQLKVRNVDSPENLDSLIKILEDELGASIENEIGTKDPNFNHNINSQKKYRGDRKRNKLEFHENNQFLARHHPESDAFKIKNVMGNHTKKLCSDVNEKQYMGDNLDRKKAITNIDTQRWVSTPEHSFNTNASAAMQENIRRLIPSSPQSSLFGRKLQYLNPDQKGDRKHKMFKFAGHRL